jgi:tetraacyldisaccharide 4'-kinase
MKTPRFWQHPSLLGALLSPLGYLYGLGARFDRTHTIPERAPLPVIALGNAVAGGAGKTPTAMALAPLLRAYNPYFITRGYGGRIRYAHRVAPGDVWQDVGDEPLLLAHVAPTWIGASRVEAARAAHLAGAGIVIADDALQHHALHKDTTLLVIDGGFGIGNGRLLPAGPLREPLEEALKRSDAIVFIGEDKTNLLPQLGDKPIFHAQMVPDTSSTWVKGTKLLAFAGLARPQKFYDTLRELGGDVVLTQNFPDHHAYSDNDLQLLLDAAERIGATPISTTKDAVKFPARFRNKIRILPVTLQFAEPAALQNWLQSRLPQPI